MSDDARSSAFPRCAWAWGLLVAVTAARSRAECTEECSSLLQSAASVSTHKQTGPSQIPCLIHQTWKTHELSFAQKSWSSTWIQKNPTCEYRLWDDAEEAALVQSASKDLIWPIWNGLTPVQRADVFRYLVLYVHGGYWADIDVACLLPIAELQIPSEASMIVGYETGRRLEEQERQDAKFTRTEQFEQWFLASAPGSPVLRRCLELIRQKFSWRIKNTLELTGPGTFTDAVHEFLEKDAPDALPNLVEAAKSDSFNKHLFPSEHMYTSGNWSMWILASERVASPVGYTSKEDPGKPIIKHWFAGTWKSRSAPKSEAR